MKFDLAGKTAIVTGGANGIGKACCLMLADYGANVVVADLKEEAAQGVAAEIGKNGGEALAVSCNVTQGRRPGWVGGQNARRVWRRSYFGQ